MVKFSIETRGTIIHSINPSWADFKARIHYRKAREKIGWEVRTCTRTKKKTREREKGDEEGGEWEKETNVQRGNGRTTGVNEKITTRSGQICGLSILFDLRSCSPKACPPSLSFPNPFPPSSRVYTLTPTSPAFFPSSFFHEPLRIGKRS